MSRMAKLMRTFPELMLILKVRTSLSCSPACSVQCRVQQGSARAGFWAGTHGIHHTRLSSGVLIANDVLIKGFRVFTWLKPQGLAAAVRAVSWTLALSGPQGLSS